jgi:uncharacterized membrane protein
MSVYLFLKLVHILAAIVALGFNFSYAIWAARGVKTPEHLLFTLKGIKFLDDYAANPSYLVSVATGLAMSYVAGYSILETRWILYALIIFGGMGIVGFGLYTPALRKQIKVLETQGMSSPAYQQVNSRQTILGLILFGLALSMLALMVFKPQ